MSANFSTVVAPPPKVAKPSTKTSQPSSALATIAPYTEGKRRASYENIEEALLEILQTKMSKKDLAREEEGIRSRLEGARFNTLLAILMGGAQNPAAAGLMQASTQQENLLSYLYDTIRNNPDEYLRQKNEDTIVKLGPAIAGFGQFIVSGGEGNAEALAAVASYFNSQAAKSSAGAQWAGVNAQLQASLLKGGGAFEDVLPQTAMYVKLVEAGVIKGSDKKHPLYKAMENELKAEGYWKK